MNRKLLLALQNLCRPGDTVVCALSGGADSVALLHGLLAVKEECSIHVAAAHFNHCLRGAESDDDEAFARELCARWGVELAVGRGDPRTLSGKSPEEAARELRYEFLLAQLGLIATAHHADDQAETVLLNLLRGTGLRGLCGMQPRQGRVIRPLLEVSRQEILAYVQTNNLSYCSDRTNEEDHALRNRLRHHVVPLLRKENPNLTETVSRMTGLLRQEEAFLQTQAEELLKEAARQDGYDCSVLSGADPILRRRAIRSLLPNPKPTMTHVEAVERLLSGSDGSAYAELSGGFLARRTYDRLTFAPVQETAGFAPVLLTAGETVRILDMELSLTGPVTLSQPVDEQTTFAIRVPQIQVRPRQTGDTVCLPGGRKTLKKWMIDRKIPAHQRELLPVFADEEGVFAVFGMGCDQNRKALPGEQAWILRVEKKEREYDPSDGHDAGH